MWFIRYVMNIVWIFKVLKYVHVSTNQYILVDLCVGFAHDFSFLSPTLGNHGSYEVYVLLVNGKVTT